MALAVGVARACGADSGTDSGDAQQAQACPFEHPRTGTPCSGPYRQDPRPSYWAFGECIYEDTCCLQPSCGCGYAFNCADGAWREGSVCAYAAQCPDSAPSNGERCKCPYHAPRLCTYGDCAHGDTHVTTADCSDERTWQVSTNAC